MVFWRTTHLQPMVFVRTIISNAEKPSIANCGRILCFSASLFIIIMNHRFIISLLLLPCSDGSPFNIYSGFFEHHQLYDGSLLPEKRRTFHHFLKTETERDSLTLGRCTPDLCLRGVIVFHRCEKLLLNEWVLISTSKKLVWSTRIDRIMTI